MALLDLSPDELLSTTRAVRKRLDFDRPVEKDVIRDCIRMAMQAPSGSNMMTMQFVCEATTPTPPMWSIDLDRIFSSFMLA